MSYNRYTQPEENRAHLAEGHRAAHLANVASARLKPLDWGSELGIRREDIAVFVAAAKVFDHIVIVRATNVKSLCYIGEMSYTPKPIDCKPKTADENVFISAMKSQVSCAGLVVDPTVVGYAAFKDNKFEKAREAWATFLGDKSPAEQAKKVFHRKGTKGFYAVDMDEYSPLFGCLMLSDQDVPAEKFKLSARHWQNFKRVNMCYIHGDYDLYGLIDVAKVERVVGESGGRGKVASVRLKEQLCGKDHYFTERFFEIQAFLNNGFGVKMIQHASQDIVNHQDDELYVFTPTGGKYRMKDTADAIMDVYERVFYQEVTR